MMMQKRVQVLFSPPSLLEGMVLLDGAADIIKKLDHIIYCGGVSTFLILFSFFI